MTPVGILISSIQGVVFLATAKIQDDLPTAKKVFLSLFSLISLSVPPLMMIIILLADEIVMVTYGEEWIDAATYLVPLSVAVIFYALMAIQGPILAGIGKPQLELRIAIITALLGRIG
jgi:PST family polysaccharide transporter